MYHRQKETLLPSAGWSANKKTSFSGRRRFNKSFIASIIWLFFSFILIIGGYAYCVVMQENMRLVCNTDQCNISIDFSGSKLFERILDRNQLLRPQLVRLDSSGNVADTSRMNRKTLDRLGYSYAIVYKDADAKKNEHIEYQAPVLNNKVRPIEKNPSLNQNNDKVMTNNANKVITNDVNSLEENDGNISVKDARNSAFLESGNLTESKAVLESEADIHKVDDILNDKSILSSSKEDITINDSESNAHEVEVRSVAMDTDDTAHTESVDRVYSEDSESDLQSRQLRSDDRTYKKRQQKEKQHESQSDSRLKDIASVAQNMFGYTAKPRNFESVVGKGLNRLVLTDWDIGDLKAKVYMQEFQKYLLEYEEYSMSLYQEETQFWNTFGIWLILIGSVSLFFSLLLGNFRKVKSGKRH